MTPLRLLTLGSLRLESGTGKSLLSGRRKDLVLLAYLARRTPRAVPRAELAALLWEQRNAAQARHSLRQALHNLRQAIGEGLEIGPAEVRLREDVVELDAGAFERDVAAGRLREAAARWAGVFLPETEDAGGESYRSWLEAERERLRRLLGWTLERLTRTTEEQGAWAEAAGWAGRWAEQFPYDETAHTCLIEALRLAGRAGEAMAHHAAFTARLRQEVGDVPSAAFERLGETLRQPTRRPKVGGPGAAALFTPDMVGRGVVFAELTAAWQELEAGAVLLVEGDVGIGKTRLCQEFLRWLRGREPVVLLHAAAQAADDEPRFSTLRRLLATLPTAPGLAGASNTALAELSTVVPPLRERFARLPEATGSELALAGALREVLRDVAAEVPVVFLLDDLPSADAGTQRLVLELAQDATPSVLVLLTGRPERLEAAGLGAKLRQSPHLRSLRLQPLSERDVEALLDSMLAIAPEARHALARRLRTETGGNPLYLVELVRSLADEGLLSLGPDGVWQLSPELAERSLPLPSQVREITRERFAHLPAEVRSVLEAAAALGPRVDPEALEAAAGLPPAAFAPALDTLIARRLLRESAAPRLAYEFTHETLRRVAHEQLSPRQREALRQNAARRAAQSPERTHPSADLVILPFTVTGREEHAVFGEGMLDLLAAALDGTGGLRCADARVVLDYLAALAPTDSAMERGRLVAEHFGARWFVLGNLIAAAGKVRIGATAFRTDSPPETARRIVVDGAETDLLGLIDRTAVELLLQLDAHATSGLLQLFHHRTASIAALRAYLDGEAALRNGDLDRAIDSFRAASSHDPGFALAYYRLAYALEWTYQPESTRLIAESLLSAARLVDRLPEQMRVLVRARIAAMRGAGEEAVQLFRSVLSVAPHNVEAWYGLGSAIFHYAQLWGGTMSEAREPFEQVLAREPDHLAAAVFLASIAAAENRHAELRALSERILQGDPRSVHFTLQLAIRMQLAYGLPDRELQERVSEELRSAKDNDLDCLLIFPFLVGEDLDAAGRAVTLFTELGRSATRRATGHALLAAVELTRGRWGAARSQLENAERLDAALALECLALFCTSPFLSPPAEELRLLREHIRSWTPPRAAEVASSFLLAPQLELHPLLLRYLEGVLSVELEEWDAAESAARCLELADQPDAMPTLGRGLAQWIRARMAAAQGLPEAALSAMDLHRPEIPWPWLVASGVLSGAHERFLRAEQLVRLNRLDEAKRWFTAATGLSPFDVVLMAPTTLELAQLAEAQGDRDTAAHHYRRFLALWRDCDPELQPLVGAAAQGLARLGKPPLPASLAPDRTVLQR